MSLLPGAEPYHHLGGPIGVLLCHGFTGTPQPLRPWAEHLARAGLTVALPRLPGHGTSWREMARTRWQDWYAELERVFAELRGRCTDVFVGGLSLGGCMALRLAEQHGAAVTGVIVVNPALHSASRLFLIGGLLKWLVPSVPGIVGDIKKEGVREVGYDRVPARAAASLPKLWRLTQGELPKVTQPVLVFHSPEDHVVGARSLQLLRERVATDLLSVRSCENSYHVATLDNDAEMIFAESLDFILAHAATGSTQTPEGRRRDEPRRP